LKVHLALDVVRRLGEQLQFDTAQTTGQGILFGKTIEGGTQVLDFQPAAGSIPERVAANNHDGSQRLVVGYYRSETSDSLRLNDSDLALARTCFAQPYHVFLIIQLTGIGPPNASFFFHDSNGKMAEFSLMEFPFEPSLLAGEEDDRLKRSQESAARRSAAILPAGDPRPRPDWISRVAFGLLLLLALLGGAGISANSRSLQAWWSRTRSTRVNPPRPVPVVSALAIGLHAKREHADVEITWNRESPVITAATSGFLSIQDGGSRRDIALDIDRLRNSSIVYSPASDQVSLQLSVTTPVSTLSESIMLLLPDNGSRNSNASPAPKKSGSRTLKRFTPPTTIATTSEPVMASLPLLMPVPGTAADQDSIPILITQPTLFPPPGKTASAPLSGAQANIAAKSGFYRAAEPLRRIVPRLAPQLLAMLTKPITIEARITVDKTGRVAHAEALPHAGVNKLVLEQVVTAARSWIFKPALRGDDPVSSEFVLQFYFGQ
jgi:hypothetical protein